MTSPGFILLLVLAGSALLGLSWLCWTGRLRGWADIGSNYAPRSFFITVLPGCGLTSLGFGITAVLASLSRPIALGFGALAGFLGLLTFIGGFMFAIWDPDWFGPRWYRELKRAFDGEPVGALSWMRKDPLQGGESGYDATGRHLSSDRPKPPFQRARLVHAPEGKLAAAWGEPGKVFYYPHGLIFALENTAGGASSVVGQQGVAWASVGRGSPRVTTIIPVESVQAAREVSRDEASEPPSGWSGWPWSPARVDADTGPWVFEALRAERMITEIERRYLDPARRPYGVRRPRGQHTPSSGPDPDHRKHPPGERTHPRDGENTTPDPRGGEGNRQLPGHETRTDWRPPT